MEQNHDAYESQRNGAESSADDALDQGRKNRFMDVDRMVNEGLGGGYVTINNGLIDASTTDTMDHPDSVLKQKAGGETE